MPVPIGRRSTTVPASLNDVTNLSAGESEQRVLDLSAKLLERKRASSADIAVLLFFTANSSTDGSVSAAVQKAVRDVFLELDIKPADVARIRAEFLSPYHANLNEASLMEAYQQLAGTQAGFNPEAAKKLFALAASRNQVTAQERAGLVQVINSGQMSESTRLTMRADVMDLMLASLNRVMKDPNQANPIVEELLAQAAAVPGNSDLFERTQEAFVQTRPHSALLAQFKEVARSASDASRLELEVFKRLVAGADSKLHAAGVRSLLARLNANGTISTEEQAFLDELDTDPDGIEAVRTKVQALSMFDAAWRAQLESLLEAEAGKDTKQFEAALTAVIALGKRSGVSGPLPAERQTAIVDAWRQYIQTPGPEALREFKTLAWCGLKGQTRSEAIIGALASGEIPVTLPSNPNPYPPINEVRGGAIRSGSEIFTPMMYQQYAYLEVGPSTGAGVNQFFMLNPNGANDTSVAEHNGNVFASNNGLLNVIARGARAPQPLPSAGLGPGFHLVEHQGQLLAVAGREVRTFDDATQRFSAPREIPDVGTSPILTSAGERGLVAFSRQESGLIVLDAPSGQRSLPPLAIVPDSATVQGSTLLVTGGSTANPNSRQIWALDLSTPEAAWRQVKGDMSAYLVLDRGSVLGAKDQRSLLGELNLDFSSVVGSVDAANADGAKLKQLAEAVLEGLGEEPKLDAEMATNAVDVLVTLDTAGLLTADLRARADALFASKELNEEAANVLGEKWFGAGRSGLTQADLDAAIAAARQTQPMRSTDVTRILALARLQPTGQALLNMPQGELSEADLLRVNAALSRCLSAQADALILKPKVQAEDVAPFLALAQELRKRSPSTGALNDLTVRRVLIFGRLTGTTADSFRPSLAASANLTQAEVRLALAWFQSNGGITTAELRALAALTDSDGVRSEGEQKALESLDWRQLSANARKNAPAVIRGVTTESTITEDDPVGAGPAKVNGSGNLVVWAKENKAASDSELYSVGIEASINATAEGLKTDQLFVSGQTVLTTADGQQPYVNGRTVTADGFDQVQALWMGDHLLGSLQGAGVDVQKLLAGARNTGTLRMHANAFPDKNAFYSSTQNELMFGTSGDTWHLASDMDVVSHELGHYVLDHLNPNMLRNEEGRAIHEGFGDAMAALMFNDAEISEDWQTNGFLRNADNELKLSQVSTECHDRGKVYAGFIWSAKRELGRLLGDDEKARQLMLGVSTSHALLYGSSSVDPQTFAAAMMRGAEAYLAGKVEPGVISGLRDAMQNDAIKRELAPAGWTPPSTLDDGVGINDLRARLERGLGVFGTVEPSDIADRMQTAMDRSDVQFAVVGEQRVGALHKVTVQARAFDARTGKMYPVEDGFVSASLQGARMLALGGRGRSLSGAFDFTEPPFSQAEARIRAMEFAKANFAKESGSVGLSDYVTRNLADIFDPSKVTYEEVMIDNMRARKVVTSVGEFVVRADEKISVSRLAHMDEHPS